ncbi:MULTISPECIES: DUF6221 family protein [unclassified Nonomuraea]|uniref:DUF6221 family protein n=1 Tax=unclassified Nonomuraea TaxID=2593643 RepID=UPI0033F501E6
MSVDDLIAFLRARLDEDEQAALDWQQHKQVLTEQFMNDPHRKHVRLRREPVTDARLSEYAYHDRFEPARVLREVEAKRALVGLWSRASSDDRRGGYSLRTLALPYADHPDYRHEWRP